MKAIQGQNLVNNHPSQKVISSLLRFSFQDSSVGGVG